MNVDPTRTASVLSPNPLAEFPTGAAQLARVCQRGRSDLVARALCSSPKIDSLGALQQALGLTFADRSQTGFNDAFGNPGFALLGHSTSIVGREVSAINPRAFMFTTAIQRSAGYVVLSFTRGSPLVELAAQDPMGRLTFYLLKFELACEANNACTHGDLLTPAIERDWRGVSLYDDEDLKNTIVDCRQCHQPDGPNTNSFLRMQEQRIPWSHWFTTLTAGGAALQQDFMAAHGQAEDYAGIPAALVTQASPLAMQLFVEGQGFANQPNVFESVLIENEVNGPLGQVGNLPTAPGPTWQGLYAAAASGRFIPPPYYQVKVTDPLKLATATAAYQGFLAGNIAPSELIDIRDVFLDEALPYMTFVPAKNTTGREIVVQACSQCHNSRLDQTLSRARFDATRLDQMSREAKQEAIARVSLPVTELGHMPPSRIRTLPPDALQRVLDELRK